MKRKILTYGGYYEAFMATLKEKEQTAVEEARSGKNPNKVYDNIEDLFNDLNAEIAQKDV